MMLNTKYILEIILKAWRYYDDENDLARFETLMEAAIAALTATTGCYAKEILQILFAVEGGESDGGEG